MGDMRLQTHHVRLIVFVLALATAGFAQAAPRQVCIELFGEAGCVGCETVRRDVLPDVRAVWGERVTIWDRDIFDQTNYLALVAYRERFAVRRDDTVSLVVDGCRYLGGVGDIRQGLMTAVAERLDAPPPAAPQTASVPVRVSDAYRRFGWGLVLVAGLADGFNPCAIGTLIFFVSLLVAGRAGRRRMAAAGMAFCLGVFATYVILGFGLLHACRAAESLPEVRFWFRVVLSGMLAVLAALSIRDAVAYTRSGGNADSVMLKLPRRLQAASRRLARRGVAARWLLPGCAAMGVAVTLIGTLCTGQAYLPALAFMARQGSLRATAMLLAYNAMFVLPLVAILAAALLGWRSVDMAAWSRREVVAAKVALGLLFVVMAGALWLPV